MSPAWPVTVMIKPSSTRVEEANEMSTSFNESPVVAKLAELGCNLQPLALAA
jgi:hypothetical protein